MSKHNYRQAGFSAIEALLIILVVAVIGFGGYFVWHSRQNNNSSTKVATQSKTSQAPSVSKAASSTAYFTIDSQHVRLPLTSEMASLKPGKVENSTYNTNDKFVSVYAPQLDSNWSCVADSNGNKGTIGAISITTQAVRSGSDEPSVTKKIGNYTYGFEEGGSNCTSSSAYGELVSAFEAQFKQLEAY